jgi:predicted small lipoprotein YifL
MKSARRAVVGLAAAGAVVLLSACGSSGPVDFGKSAEKFIQSDKVAKPAKTTFTNASCGEPSDSKPGSKFSCTATSADGKTWTFDMVVKDAHNFELFNGKPKG